MSCTKSTRYDVANDKKIGVTCIDATQRLEATLPEPYKQELKRLRHNIAVNVFNDLLEGVHLTDIRFHPVVYGIRDLQARGGLVAHIPGNKLEIM